VNDLTPGVHAAVGAAGAGDLDRMLHDPADGARQLAGDRALPGLGSEPFEPGAVVGDEHPDANQRPLRSRWPTDVFAEERHTNSMRAIGALSPWRGPSLRMRV